MNNIHQSQNASLNQNLEGKSQNHNSKYKSDLRERCSKFSLEFIAFIDTLPNQRSCWIIADQLLRSGTSIGANLTEATASSSRLEFKRYHEIALKSANETKYWLSLLEDSGKANRHTASLLSGEVAEVANMVAAGILRLKGKK